MATVLEERTNQEQRSLVLLLWTKGLSAKDIHKDIFSLYVGKFSLRKAVHNRMPNVSLMAKRFERRCVSG
jgi:hypothetical protein